MTDIVLKDLYDSYLTEHLTEILNFGVRNKGATRIHNKANVLKTSEIHEILNLLHPDYNDLGMTINIHKNRFRTFIHWVNPYQRSFFFDTYKMIFKRQIGGNHNEGIIDLFPFNHIVNGKEYVEEFNKLFTVFDLIHEVRHAYQRIHKKKKYNKGIYINATNKGYDSQWVEKDANSFTQRFMNNNKDKINSILGLNIKWDCIWGRMIIYKD